VGRSRNKSMRSGSRFGGVVSSIVGNTTHSKKGKGVDF
jgi:hypothetical protein